MLKTAVAILFAATLAALLALPVSAQDTSPSPAASAAPAAAGQPNEAEMMKQMMEMAKLNDNHKLLASTAGKWAFTVKMWMNGDPNSKPEISKGTATREAMMGGRFVVMSVEGKMEMPRPDGKMKAVTFRGHGTDGYDNAKQKFVSTWFDNMSTGIMMSEGTYDPATKSLTYTGEMEPLPGMKQQVKEVLSFPDKDHMKLDWFENRGGQEVKTMEIDYTRKK